MFFLYYVIENNYRHKDNHGIEQRNNKVCTTYKMSKKNGLFFSFFNQFKDDLVSLLGKLKLSTNFYQWNFFISNYIRNSFVLEITRSEENNETACLLLGIFNLD